MGAIYFLPSVLSCYFIYENLFILCFGGADEILRTSVFLLPFDGVVGCRSQDTHPIVEYGTFLNDILTG